MIPRRAQEIENRRTHRKRALNMWMSSPGPCRRFRREDSSAFRLGDDFHVTIVRVHQDGFSVIVERITGGEIFDVGLVEFALEPPMVASCGSVKTDVQEQGWINGF